MQSFDDVSGLFNVVVVSAVPGAEEYTRHSEVATFTPVTWQRGCQWVHGMLTGIGRDWEASRYVDCYLEPADCRRPWTPELAAAHRRELLRNDPATAQERERGEYLHGELCRCIGKFGIQTKEGI